jgi:RNA polymerase sigma factor (sigma-70 family)
MAMATRSVRRELPNQLTSLLRFGVVGDCSDGQLVQRFLSARDGADQAAFTALVVRHGPMVFSVCREVLDNACDAEDAFQATFLVLARKAASVRKLDSLASWLHRVAVRVAIHGKAEAARRRLNERRLAVMKAVQLAREDDAVDGCRELHEEIALLPEHYRQPVVLHYLEGLTTEEAAMRIGCPLGTVLSRLSRARERLRGRLERRGLTPSKASLMLALTPRTWDCVATGLLNSTVQAAFGFAGRRASEAGMASASAIGLAKGVLHTMSISKLKILATTTLVCGLACGGALTFAQIGGLGSQPRDRSSATPEQREAELDRSMNKLQFELDESVRRNADIQKALQEVRAELEHLRAGKQASLATKVASRRGPAIHANSAQAVSRLAEALKGHPVTPRTFKPYFAQIYMMDLVEGRLTIIAAEPAPDLNHCGMAKWSHDGSRILFQAGTMRDWPRGRIWAIDVREGRPSYTDLGDGNDPTFSPDGWSIAFLLHASVEAGMGGSVMMMRADGSARHHVTSFGSPFWSPFGRELLINSYSLPTRSTMFNLETKKGRAIEVPDHQIFSWPSWVGPGTVVTALAPKEKYEGDSIALLDVREPAEAKILEVLWKRDSDLNVIPRWPVFRPGTNQCFFEGVEPREEGGPPERRALYSLERGESQRAKPMGLTGHEHIPGSTGTGLGSLSFSPDGRYLLIDANGPLLLK